MEFVRKAVLVLIVPLFVVFLFATASNTATLTVATDKAKIKSVIARSDIYRNVLPGLLDQAGQISGAGEQVSLQVVVVRQAAEKTFTPQFVQENTEAVIDSIYSWLNGETPLPDFTIDLTEAKATFAANVSDAVEQRLAALPACPTGGVPDNYDPLTATCLPPGVDPASQAAAIEENIISGTGFLDHPVITADTLKPEGDAQSIFDGELKQIPEVYQKIKVLPIILGILSLLLAAGIIFLSASKRKGVRRVGISLFVVGVILLFIAWDLTRLVGEGLENLNLNNEVVEDSLRTLALELTKEVDKIYWMFGGAYTALGAAAIVWTILRAPKGGKPDKDDLEGEGETPEDRIELHEPDKPTEFVSPRESSKPPAKPSPAKLSPKIQEGKPKPAPKKPAAKKITVQ